MIQEQPKFIINPSLLEPSWQGDAWGFRAFKNKSYLNSVWLGTVWNFACIPQRIYFEVVRPLLFGNIGGSLLGIFIFFMLTASFLIAGIQGNLVMLPYDLATLADSIVLDEEQAAREIKNGVDVAKRNY